MVSIKNTKYITRDNAPTIGIFKVHNMDQVDLFLKIASFDNFKYPVRICDSRSLSNERLPNDNEIANAINKVFGVRPKKKVDYAKLIGEYKIGNKNYDIVVDVDFETPDLVLKSANKEAKDIFDVFIQQIIDE